MMYVKKVENQTKCDRVVDQIKDLIIRGIYKSGMQLPTEMELCDMFGVSRITIRGSLKKLSMAGLIDIKQGKGTFVKNIDLSTFMKPIFQLVAFDEIDVETIYDARVFIEGGTAYLAAQSRTDEECEVLKEILYNFKDAIKTQDVIASNRLDSDFHIEIAKMSQNTLLYACVCAVEEINRACIKRISKFSVSLSGNYQDHKTIYEKILNQDADGAKKAMIEHTNASRQVLLE